MPLIPPQAKPPQVISQIATPTKRLTLEEAEEGLFAALDSGAPPARAAGLAPRDRAAYGWLWNAAAWKPGAPAPANPFPRGAASQEAEAWRTFLASGKGDPADLPLAQDGSRLLLWTWMRDRDRREPLPKAARARLEDRLLGDGPAMLQGWALRHALCFAIADGDVARFSALKAGHGDMAPDTFAGAQTLFGLLGGPSPDFRLWKLPDLAYQDTRLGDLGARRVWVCPEGIPVPEGAAWIIPSSTGEQPGREAELNRDMKAEAGALASRLQGRAAWFAASRGDWEAAGLVWFPILIDLDRQGNLARIRMGDAAP